MFVHMVSTDTVHDEISVLDLFAGAGGLTAGFHSASSRFRSVRAVEMDQAAAASYEATFGKGVVFAGPIQRWLESEPVPQVDVVVGGPPCQGFSTLGKQDAEDVRNTLWKHYAATIVRAEPKYFVVENVAAFARSSQFEDFVDSTSPGGVLHNYGFNWGVLNAADFGSPQARKRAVLIGHRRDQKPVDLPSPTHAAKANGGLLAHATVRQTLEGVPRRPDRDDRFLEESTEFSGKRYAGYFVPRDLHWSRNYSELSLKRFADILEGGNRFQIDESRLPECWKKHKTGSADVMGRLHWDKPSVTIRTEFFKPEKGRYLHPVEDRAITHYEAALLQGFPPGHKFVGSRTAIAKQIGNAVPIPLGAAIARQLLERL
jgi:DNA (cytosine-5)-methyltransferase 1